MAPKGKGNGKGKGKGNGKSNSHRKPTATSSDSTPSLIISREVIFNILARLPVKSLLRFKCVSGQWRTITAMKSFTSRHLTYSPPSILLHAPKFRPIPQLLDAVGHVIYSYGHRSQIPDTLDRIFDFPGSDMDGVPHYLEIIGSVNGVVCVVEYPECRNFTLWNPATRSTLSLPAPNQKFSLRSHNMVFAGMGLDRSSGDYKIIRLLTRKNKLSDVVEVLSVRRGRWGLITHGSRMLMRHPCSAVADGVPYWRSFKEGGDVVPRATPEKLVWFDVEGEFFREEEFAWEVEKCKMYVGEVNDRLGAIVRHEETLKVEVWIREGPGRWINKYRVTVAGDGVAVGFYGWAGVVLEEGDEGNLLMIELEEMKKEGLVNMEEGLLNTLRVVGWKESLTPMPKLGKSLI